MKHFNYLLAFGSLALLTANVAHAKMEGMDCRDPEASGLKSAKKLLQKYGITDGCPHQESSLGDSECSKHADDIEKWGAKWQTAHDSVCKALDESQAKQNLDCTNNEACIQSQATAMTTLHDAVKAERAVVKEIRSEMKAISKDATTDIAQTVVNDIVVAQDNPLGTSQASVNENVANNQGVIAINNYQDPETAQQAVEAIRNKDNSALSDITSNLLKEPLGVAAAANDMDTQMQKREQQLAAMEATASAQAKLNKANASGLNTKNTSASNATHSTAKSEVGGVKSKEASLADAKSNPSSSGDQASGGGSMPNLGSLAGAGAGGGGGSSEKSSSTSPAAAQTASTSFGAENKASLENSEAKPGVNINTMDAKAKVDSDALAKAQLNSSGSSIAPDSAAKGNSALRDRLRAQLQEGGSSAPSGPSLASASDSKGSGYVKGRSGTNLRYDDANAANDYSTSLSTGGGFDMAGSETEDEVKNLVQGFQSSERSPASEGANPELGSMLGEETVTLFERTKETYQRVQLRGLLSARRSTH